jgi:tRNA-dihydrouridine synthase B
MAGVTDLPFRLLCRRFGAGLAVSEMISSNAAVRRDPKTRQRLTNAGEPGPLAVQIVGASPQDMASAARFAVQQGADIIDINMGCPAKKICRIDAGSALLRNESLVAMILHAVVKAVDRPVTLKMRTGWEPGQRNAPRIARIAEDEGIQAIAIHGRTRACGYSGTAEYDTIARVKQAAGIPIIANGDMRSPEDIRRVLDYTGADAAMIGRGAQGRPWLFRQANAWLEQRRTVADPPPGVVLSILEEHLDMMQDFYGEYQGLRIARKHIAWYSRGYPGGGDLRQAINRIDDPGEQRDRLRAFFERQRAWDRAA